MAVVNANEPLLNLYHNRIGRIRAAAGSDGRRTKGEPVGEWDDPS